MSTLSSTARRDSIGGGRRVRFGLRGRLSRIDVQVSIVVTTFAGRLRRSELPGPKANDAAEVGCLAEDYMLGMELAWCSGEATMSNAVVVRAVVGVPA